MKTLILFLSIFLSLVVHSQSVKQNFFSVMDNELIEVSMQLNLKDTTIRISISNFNNKPIYIKTNKLYESIFTEDSVSNIFNVSWEEDPNFSYSFKRLAPNETVTIEDKIQYMRVRLKIEYLYGNVIAKREEEVLNLKYHEIKYPLSKIILSNYF